MRKRSETRSPVTHLILAVAFLGNVGCGVTGPGEIRLGLSVAPDSMSLQVGQQAEVTAGVSTTNLDEDEVEVSFRVRDSDVATVTRTDDRSATVMGQRVGETVISVVAASNGSDPIAIEDSVHVSIGER